MADGKKRVRDLILKHLRDELSPLEHIELQEWVNASAVNRQIFDELADPDHLRENLIESLMAPARVRAKLDRLLEKEETFASPHIYAATASPEPVYSPSLSVFIPGSRSRTWIYAVAACFFLAVGAVWLLRQYSKSSSLADKPSLVQDIAPGGNKALLTLSDGSKIVLENAGNGTLVKQGNTAVSKDSNRLSYASLNSHTPLPSPSSATLYNVLTTPRAGQYQVLLPDGTKVFLNNASSLRYPTSFSGNDRQVSLSGEAYFIVAKDVSKPFIVNTDRLSVHVLGTSFDVMAYTDEQQVTATLVSGSVKVQSSSSSGQVLLHPGEQALASADGTLSTHAVDADESVAWTRGYFHFSHESISDVLRQLSRWYDVKVEFSIAAPAYVYDGEIGRDLSLSSILKHLEKPDLHFRIDGQQLIVTH